MSKRHIPYYSHEELSALEISSQDVIRSIESVIHQFSINKAWAAPKATILPDDGRYMMATLAASDEPELLAVKTIVLNPENPSHNLPQINGLVTMLNSKTGLPVAILDGNWITAVRTAALSATAAKYMARKSSSTIAFIGCGVQAQSHLKTFVDLFPLKKAYLLGRGKPNIDSLTQSAQELGLTTSVCRSVEEAVKDADIVISSITYSSTLSPFIHANDLKEGSFSAITDLAVPWIKDSFAALDNIIIDDLAQEAAAPNKLLPMAYIDGDLSKLVMGKIKGRTREDERNAFAFRGHAMGDLALSMLAYETHHKSTV